jgi:hypothetical protein
MPINTVRCAAMAALLAAATGCGEKEVEDGFVRGPGLKLTQLPVPAKVAIYDAALRTAFDVGPGLTLLLDPRLLPRTTGLGPGTPVPKNLVDALRERGVVAGLCQPPGEATREAPQCDVANPGYIVRFSDVFRMRGDSVQVHVAVEQFNTSTSAKSAILRFEKAFQLVGKGTTWRVVRQGRVTLAAERDRAADGRRRHEISRLAAD